ncbi:MBL fold metallo-hydrolase [Mucilaginibacter robiniae]|uniref:MBL fold metallo-hydrolase n=1 Tax=Mucilaginibacter robiniae TaxID=2728022 RepID=A0A7L5E442_9SPHI|nr:MBL fold metallo-hydrolase [Mucilaginibacter robiniae]QJD97049.1 MBL fold metallo-hydrolase [Mucilaginibacter robiniae]
MALFITSLNSGSNGNCYYVGNHQEAVLVDAGISCREIERRMLRLGLSMRKIKALFVSHEHSDHIRGITVLAKKYQLPVYITPATLRYGRLELEAHLVKTFCGYEPVVIGDITVTAFPKFHDAAEPHSFVVSCQEVKVGVFTDIGAPCEHLIKHFKQCHAAFLEANYDEQMLAQGNYPYHLKRRISGGHGHLSNLQALELFVTHRPLFMSHLLLSHLSRDNNDPAVAHELFSRHAGGTEIIVASRYEETPVYHIRNLVSANRATPATLFTAPTTQFSLF